MEGSEQTFVAQMSGIVKTFPGVRALDGIDFQLKSGEIHGLVGKNGAGKSTLMNVFTGIYPCDSGQIHVNGELIEPMTTGRAKEVGIAYVHQHSKMIEPLSIAENISAGSLPTNRFGLVDWKKLYDDADQRLRRVGLEIDVRRKVEGLSVAERQMIEIAKALFADAQIIILDEATAPLPKDEVEMLFSFVRRQRDRGVAFIYISHYIEEVFELCDVVTILRDGKLVGTEKTAAIDQQELIRLISGAKLERFKRERRGLGWEADPVLEIKNLSRPGAYQNVNLTIRQGEIVGLTGLEGCGKAMLARGVFGLEPLGEGQVLLSGEPFKAKLPDDALDQGLAYLPRDRHGYGIIGLRSIRENISLPILKRLRSGLVFLNISQESKIVSEFIEKLGIVTPSESQRVEFLSGGNQQKVVFAKLASTEPKILLLDEPTQGVDVQAKVEIMKIVDEMSQQGVAIVFVSEEIREMVDICDRIVVMYDGEIVSEFDTTDSKATIEQIMLAVEGSLSQDEEHAEEIHSISSG